MASEAAGKGAEALPSRSLDDAARERLMERYRARLDVLNAPGARDRIDRIFAKAGRLDTPVIVPDSY